MSVTDAVPRPRRGTDTDLPTNLAKGETSGGHLKASHGFVTLGVAASLVAVLAGVLFGTGNVDHLVDLLPGRAWLANDERGSVTLVNGATGEPEFEMRFRDAAGDEFEVVQGAEGVFVVNRTTGEITRIDGATQTIGGSIKVEVGDEPLFVIGGGRAYLVLKALGTIQEIDPSSPDLAPVGNPVPLGAAIGSAVVDGSGIVAAAVLGSGKVAFVDGAAIAGEVIVNRPGDPLAVTLVDGQVVAVAQDLGKGKVTAAQVQPSGVTRSQEVDVPAAGEVLVAPKMDGDRLWLLHRPTATLAGVPLVGGEPRTLALDFAKSDDLGAPLPNGSYVYVPNFDQGALLKVDAETGAFLDVVKIGDDTEEFEAFVENGRVWGNDPVGGTAVVIDRDGNVRRVEKYRPGIPTNDGTGIPLPLSSPTGDTRPGDPEAGPSDPGSSGPTTPNDPDDRSTPDDPRSGPTGAANDHPLDEFLPGSLGGPADGSAGGAVDPGAIARGGTAVPTTPGHQTTPIGPAAGVPGVPGAVSAAGGDGAATVSWLPAADGGSPLLRYVITSSTGHVQTVDGSTTSSPFTGLTNGTPVSFTVRAENAIGAGPAATSNTVTPMLAIPGAPNNVSWTLTQPTWQVAVITASWDLPDDNPGAVAEWSIQCSSGGSVPTQYGFTVAAGVRSTTLDSLPPFEDYSCAIHANALDGTAGPEVAMASGTTLQPLRAASAPTCSMWDNRQRINSTLDPMEAYAVVCNIEMPTDGPFSGYIVDIHDGVSIIDHQDLPNTTTSYESGRLPYDVGNKLASFYAYYVDPISGLTVTSVAWTHVA